MAVRNWIQYSSLKGIVNSQTGTFLKTTWKSLDKESPLE